MLRGLTVLIALLLTAPAFAEMKVNVVFGFGGRWVPATWGPITVNVTADELAAATLELTLPSGPGDICRILRPVTLNPGENRYVILAPLPASSNNSSLRVVSAESGRTLVSWRPDLMSATEEATFGTQRIVLVVGNVPNVDWLLPTRRFNDVSVMIQQRAVPSSPFALESASVVVLAGTQLSSLSVAQQNAVVDWVRRGGKLLVWLGSEPVLSGPLAEILPATAAPVTSWTLSESQLKTLGLTDRFSELPYRPLTPRAGADPFAIQPMLPPAARRRVELGEVIELPFDPSLMIFNSDAQKRDAFSAVRWQLLGPDDSTDSNDTAADPYQMYYKRPSVAAHAVEVLGDMEGVGVFGFEYVLASLVALALLVGPIDWFVLRRIGRQPWTWSTTAGWVLLITTGAVLAGHLLKSGKLELRTLDIVDTQRRQSQTFVALYSPRTQTYGFNVPDDSYWSPPDLSYGYYSGGNDGSVVSSYRQTEQGNLPLPRRVPMWNLAVLQGRRELDQAAAEPPFELSLALSDRTAKGTLTPHDAATPLAILICRGEQEAFQTFDAHTLSFSINASLSDRLDLSNRPANAFWDGSGEEAPAEPRLRWQWLLQRVAGPESVPGGQSAVYVLESVDASDFSLADTTPDAQQHWRITRVIVNEEQP